MRVLAIDEAIALDPASAGAATGTAVDLRANAASAKKLPFLQGNSAVIVLSSADLSASEFKLQGSVDGGDNYTDMTDEDGNDVELDAPGTKMFNIEALPELVRWVVTAATSAAGVGSAVILQN